MRLTLAALLVAACTASAFAQETPAPDLNAAPAARSATRSAPGPPAIAV